MTASEIAEAAAEFRDKYGREPAYIGSIKNPSIVRKLWSEYPDAVPAICGGPNGLLILDVDFGNGKNGPNKLAAWLKEQGQELPKSSPITVTQSRGLHVFFRDPDGLGNHEGAFADLDTNIRGKGGYVIAPGAWREDGKRYNAAPKAPDLASAFASGSIPVLPAFIREAIQTRTRPIKVSDADAARLTLDNMPEWDDVRAKFDLDGLADRNAKMRAIVRFDDALDDAPDFSANRIKLATKLAGDYGDAFTFEDWAAIAENCEGTGHYVEKLSSEKVPGEFDLRALRREFMKAKAATKQPDGLAFGVVELSAEEMGERPHVANDNAKKPEKAKRRLTFQLFDEAAEEAFAEPETQLVEDLLDPGAMSVLYGESNAGKSFVALLLSHAVASGREFAGRKTERGLVVYIAAEGGRRINRRLAALRKQHPTISKLPLALVKSTVDLHGGTADAKEIIRLVRDAEKATDQKAALVIIDTLARAMGGGSENDGKDMSAVVTNGDLIRTATGAHLMYVHHSGKDKARGARGHSSLRAATDTEIELVSTNGARSMTVTKQRDMETGDSFEFRLVDIDLGEDENGKPRKSAVAEFAGMKPTDPRPAHKAVHVAPTEAHFMTILAKLSTDAEGGLVKVSEIRAAINADRSSAAGGEPFRELTAPRMCGLRDQLAQKGLIVNEGNGFVRLKARGDKSDAFGRVDDEDE